MTHPNPNFSPLSYGILWHPSTVENIRETKTLISQNHCKCRGDNGLYNGLHFTRLDDWPSLLLCFIFFMPWHIGVCVCVDCLLVCVCMCLCVLVCVFMGCLHVCVSVCMWSGSWKGTLKVGLEKKCLCDITTHCFVDIQVYQSWLLNLSKTLRIRGKWICVTFV